MEKKKNLREGNGNETTVIKHWPVKRTSREAWERRRASGTSRGSRRRARVVRPTAAGGRPPRPVRAPRELPPPLRRRRRRSPAHASVRYDDRYYDDGNDDRYNIIFWRVPFHPPPLHPARRRFIIFFFRHFSCDYYCIETDDGLGLGAQIFEMKTPHAQGRSQ